MSAKRKQPRAHIVYMHKKVSYQYVTKCVRFLKPNHVSLGNERDKLFSCKIPVTEIVVNFKDHGMKAFLNLLASNNIGCHLSCSELFFKRHT